jgi:hypothetical protein
MKMFEILLELPKCDTETQSEHKMLEKMVPIDFLDAGLPMMLGPLWTTPNTRWIDSWVGFRTGLDIVEKRKIFPCQSLY